MWSHADNPLDISEGSSLFPPSPYQTASQKIPARIPKNLIQIAVALNFLFSVTFTTYLNLQYQPVDWKSVQRAWAGVTFFPQRHSA